MGAAHPGGNGAAFPFGNAFPRTDAHPYAHRHGYAHPHAQPYPCVLACRRKARERQPAFP